MGWVYILTHERIPGLVKIGFTDGSIDRRVKEISDNAGVPGSYNVEYKYEVIGAESLERIIHKELSKYRYKARKEFFEIPIEYAIIITKLICERENQRLSKLNIGIRANTCKEIGAIIRAKRRKAGQTQGDIAQKTGTLQKTISAVENGYEGTMMMSVIKALEGVNLEFWIIDKGK